MRSKAENRKIQDRNKPITEAIRGREAAGNPDPNYHDNETRLGIDENTVDRITQTHQIEAKGREFHLDDDPTKIDPDKIGTLNKEDHRNDDDSVSQPTNATIDSEQVLAGQRQTESPMSNDTRRKVENASMTDEDKVVDDMTTNVVSDDEYYGSTASTDGVPRDEVQESMEKTEDELYDSTPHT